MAWKGRGASGSTGTTLEFYKGTFESRLAICLSDKRAVFSRKEGLNNNPLA